MERRTERVGRLVIYRLQKKIRLKKDKIGKVGQKESISQDLKDVIKVAPPITDLPKTEKKEKKEELTLEDKRILESMENLKQEVTVDQTNIQKEIDKVDKEIVGLSDQLKKVENNNDVSNFKFIFSEVSNFSFKIEKILKDIKTVDEKNNNWVLSQKDNIKNKMSSKGQEELDKRLSPLFGVNKTLVVQSESMTKTQQGLSDQLKDKIKQLETSKKIVLKFRINFAHISFFI